MMRWLGLTALMMAAVGGLACERADGNAVKSEAGLLEERATRLQETLTRGDSTDVTKPIARWLLPADLAEISGLALTSDQRLFTHNDETARIFEVDYRRGTIVKHFFAGEAGLQGDFEGLTYANNRFFLLSSNGMLYEFAEGDEGDRVDVTVHDTKLGKECEFEGVAYDEKSKAFVLACKNVGGKDSDANIVLYRYRPGSAGSEQIQELKVPQSKVIGRNRWKQMRPTDITVDPANGNYVLISAQEKALFELTPTGDVVVSGPLNGQHPQAEGVAITRDHILIVSDESTNQAASITLYRWQ
jgi:uncharacterized protein YjiK